MPKRGSRPGRGAGPKKEKGRSQEKTKDGEQAKDNGDDATKADSEKMECDPAPTHESPNAPSTSEDPAAEVVPFHGEMGTTIIETESCSTTSGAAEGGKGDAEPKEINQDDIEDLLNQMDDSNAVLMQEEPLKPRVQSGLEILNIPGPDALRETLTNSTDPLKSIEDFQRANGILLPSLGPALPFLDLHGMERREFHQTILNEIQDKLIGMIDKLGVVLKRGDNPQSVEDALRKLERLLDASFPVVRVKALQPIVLTTMKHLPSVRPEILAEVMHDADLYKAAATEVKRQIWEGNQSLFGDEVAPLLQDYIESKNDALFSVESLSTSFLSIAPKGRRQSRVVSNLAQYVGDKILLYDLVLQFLRTLYLRTRYMHYCTLRAEVLMALHDTKVSKITSEDPCYKFTWCLDACITDKGIDEKRGVELQMFMEGITKEQEQVLGDLAMIMSDPYAVNTVMLSIFKCLVSCLKNDQMPKDNHELVVLLKMLNLGVHAWDMIETQVFKEFKLNPELLPKFIPCVLSMMVEDKMRTVKTEIATEQVELSKIASLGLPPGTSDPPVKIPDPDPPTKPSVYFKNFVKQYSIGALVGMYYALHLVKNKDKLGLCNILPSIVNFHNEVLYEDIFLHTLVSLLITNMAGDFANDDFCMVIFDEFLFECASPTSKADEPGEDAAPSSQIIKESVVKHTLRLLWYVHPKMSVSRVETLLDFIKPTKEHSEATHKIHRSLSDKVVSGQRFSASAGDNSNSDGAADA